MTAILYTTSTCGQCVMVKKFLKLKNVQVVEKNADDPQVRQEAIKLSGDMRVPVTVLNSEIIVGYNPLRLSSAIA